MGLYGSFRQSLRRKLNKKYVIENVQHSDAEHAIETEKIEKYLVPYSITSQIKQELQSLREQFSELDASFKTLSEKSKLQQQEIDAKTNLLKTRHEKISSLKATVVELESKIKVGVTHYTKVPLEKSDQFQKMAFYVLIRTSLFWPFYLEK